MGWKGAQANLAGCYYNGDGVSRNLKRAVMWLRKAAEQGLQEAIEDLPTAVAALQREQAAKAASNIKPKTKQAKKKPERVRGKKGRRRKRK